MSKAGFWITSLALLGPRVPQAEVLFTQGLNVVSGPSDTGKTYISECIDFVLGASRKPHSIPEAEGYERVVLGLCERATGRKLSLERSLMGGNQVLLFQDDEMRALAAKHDPQNRNTISSFLLELSGFSEHKVRLNKLGKTRPLSFRDIAQLTLIDEESIISKHSPIFSGQNTDRTVESAVFRLLLTGEDDATLIQAEDPKITKSKSDAKLEVLDYLRQRIKEQLVAWGIVASKSALAKNITQTEAMLAAASEELNTERHNILLIEEQRKSRWSTARKLESRIEVLRGLRGRFNLLKDQYSSDIRRLEAITEVGYRLDQLPEERCPLCGALTQHHAHFHASVSTSTEAVRTACKSELLKIHSLLAGLHSTAEDNDVELAELSRQHQWAMAQLEESNNTLRHELQPRLNAIMQRIGEAHKILDTNRGVLDAMERLEELDRLRATAQMIDTKSDNLFAKLSPEKAGQFSQEVENLLRSWHFPGLDRVTFGDVEQDVVISGRRRSSHGKGVRALTHAAFAVALLKYCSVRSMPHPGLVVIDSPLVVYREPDHDDLSIEEDVQDAFYRALAAQFNEAQVIIFENEDPPSDLDQVANLIRFTASDHGRRGFIPPN